MSLSQLFLILALISPIFGQANCPAGQELNGGVCKLCSPGTFALRRDRSCRPCPRGTFHPFRGAETQIVCRPCYPGTFSNRKGATSCQPCPKGLVSGPGMTKCFKCDPGEPFNGFECTKCEERTYDDDGLCKACPTDLSSLPGATSIDQCKPCEELGNCIECSEDSFRKGEQCISCPPGFFTRRSGATTRSQCKPCRAGTFKPRFNKCRACLRGLTSSRAATMCRNPRKPCPKGTFETKTLNCMKCFEGYRYDPAKKTCVKCGDNEASPGGLVLECTKCHPDQVKSIFDDECFCGGGTFLADDNTCKKCPKGTYSGDGSNQCRSCEGASFADERGLKQCKPCPFGLVPTQPVASRCEPCPPGMMPRVIKLNRDRFEFPPVFFSSQCVNVTNNCPVGTDRRQVFNGSRCVKRATCTTGTPVADIGKTCTPCRKGTILIETSGRARCRDCPDDAVSEGGLQTECTKCKAGFVRDFANKTKCTCRAGREFRGGACKVCPPGSASEQSKRCKKCKPGTFAKGPEATFCADCPLNFFQPRRGGTRCTRCPPGFVTRSIGASKCVRF